MYGQSSHRVPRTFSPENTCIDLFGARLSQCLPLVVDPARMSLPKDLSDSDLQNLISLGKRRGFITYEEVNNLLPTNLVSSERLDDIMITAGQAMLIDS